ncbi:MAG: SUMF1/EgtB/PvdO family nonheme iron enzyme [Chthoniobacteraceae bacterium]
MKFVPVAGTKVLFSVWDTRVADYAAYAAANPEVDGAWKKQVKDGVPVTREPDYPVAGVSWEDAHAFCAWLTEKDTVAGRLPKGAKYRLPTDEEWSIAVSFL